MGPSELFVLSMLFGAAVAWLFRPSPPRPRWPGHARERDPERWSVIPGASADVWTPAALERPLPHLLLSRRSAELAPEGSPEGVQLLWLLEADPEPPSAVEILEIDPVLRELRASLRARLASEGVPFDASDERIDAAESELALADRVPDPIARLRLASLASRLADALEARGDFAGAIRTQGLACALAESADGPAGEAAAGSGGARAADDAYALARSARRVHAMELGLRLANLLVIEWPDRWPDLDLCVFAGVATAAELVAFAEVLAGEAERVLELGASSDGFRLCSECAIAVGLASGRPEGSRIAAHRLTRMGRRYLIEGSFADAARTLARADGSDGGGAEHAPAAIERLMVEATLALQGAKDAGLAERKWSEALERGSSGPDPVSRNGAFGAGCGIHELQLRQGRVSEAATLLTRLRASLAGLDPRDVALATTRLAEREASQAVAEGRLAEAEEGYERAEHAARGSWDPAARVIAQIAARERGRLALERGDLRAAESHLRRALAVAGLVGYDPARWSAPGMAMLLLARTLAGQGRREEAWVQARAALAAGRAAGERGSELAEQAGRLLEDLAR